MTLVDQDRMHRLYDAMGAAVEVSGGSCANTMAALAGLGAKAAYIGKVHDDQLGEVFRHDIRAVGVSFATPPLTSGPETARCLVFVTPDGQRTMATYLGACVELGPADVDAAQVEAARIVYLEGYLWDRPDAKAACIKAAEAAHRAGRQVALSLSDPFCVERWRDEFVALIERHVDILIGNEHEITRLYQVERYEDAIPALRRQCKIAALTRGAAGSLIVTPEESHTVAAAPIAKVLDTTGAGDLYAAGFLYGMTHDLSWPACGRLASLAAAQVLGQYGARSERPLAPLVEAARAA